MAMATRGGLLLLWASAVCSVASGTSKVLNGAEKGPTRGMRNSAAAAAAAAAVGPAAVGARMLQDDVCVEDTIFVNSLITDLGYPIGGCYRKSANLTLQEFPVYALEGGADVGDAWIYVSGSEGIWEIGLVDDVDEATGSVTDLSTVCTAEAFPAESFEVTDAQLDDAWQCKYFCSYFMDGVTNYAAADFVGVECGCDGRTTPTEEEGGSGGGANTTAIAIGTLVALGVLLVVVCGCVIFRVKKGKNGRNAGQEAPKEDIVVES